MPYLLYIASALGALALLMMMPRRGYNPRVLGALLGAMTLGGLWLYLADHYLPPDARRGLAGSAWMYYYVFSSVAIGAASRVITHSRPIYAALWFVMVVLASAGLFLILDAEFMAFAMVIIYGGAILVTYVFVIMLASQADRSSGPRRQGAPDGVSSAAGLSQSVIAEEEDVLVDQSTTYDRVAREPVAAVAVGFLLLALLLSVAFPTTPDHLFEPNPLAASPDDAAILRIYLPHRPDRIIGASDLDNIERIGLELFRNHPLGLELAGVILLVSLVGAVVITRTRVDVAAAESKGRQPAS